MAENILERRFDPEQWTGLNQAWAGDITYIPTSESWSYLAVLMDLHSRRVIGWAFDDHMEEGLVSRALEMALGYRQPEHDLIHHSDRGSGVPRWAMPQRAIKPSLIKLVWFPA